MMSLGIALVPLDQRFLDLAVDLLHHTKMVELSGEGGVSI